MRFLVILFLLIPLPANAAETGSATLIDECQKISRGSPSAQYCTGFLQGLIPGLRKLHSYYNVMFRNFKFNDVDVAFRYMSMGLVLGPDLCLPDDLTIQQTALALTKYAREHPEELKSSEYDFASKALLQTFNCNRLEK